MWVAQVEEGFLFGDLTPASVETLKGVPMLLESNDPRVRERLLPETCADPADEETWRRHAVPELERLFQSRASIVRRDLAAMAPATAESGAMLLIPNAHRAAWLASLNAARLALFLLNDMVAEHMDAEGLATALPKQREAARRIHLLAEVQAVLLGDYEVDE